MCNWSCAAATSESSSSSVMASRSTSNSFLAPHHHNTPTTNGIGGSERTLGGTISNSKSPKVISTHKLFSSLLILLFLTTTSTAAMSSSSNQNQNKGKKGEQTFNILPHPAVSMAIPLPPLAVSPAHRSSIHAFRKPMTPLTSPPHIRNTSPARSREDI